MDNMYYIKVQLFVECGYFVLGSSLVVLIVVVIELLVWSWMVLAAAVVVVLECAMDGVLLA